jgi:hypothetical protein
MCQGTSWVASKVSTNPEDGSHLPKRVGVYLAYINKSNWFLDASVCHFTTLQNARTTIKMRENLCSWTGVVPCGQTDGLAVVVALRSFTKLPDKAALVFLLSIGAFWVNDCRSDVTAQTDVAPVSVLIFLACLCCHQIAGDFPSRHHSLLGNTRVYLFALELDLTQIRCWPVAPAEHWRMDATGSRPFMPAGEGNVPYWHSTLGNGQSSCVIYWRMIY